MQGFAAMSGIWKVEQNSETLEMRLYKYGHEIERWQGEKEYSFEELHEILMKKTYERRGED